MLPCNRGFETLGLKEIIGLVEPTNARSKTMVSSLGFEYEGIEERCHRIEGVLHKDAPFPQEKVSRAL